jgi:lysophospholipase L1-like esterase
LLMDGVSPPAPLFRDPVHLSPKGHAWLAERIAPNIAKLLRD